MRTHASSSSAPASAGWSPRCCSRRAASTVTVLERAQAPGGKMREVEAGGAALDAGPTVFTMRWVFEEIFDEAGADFADRVQLRHARDCWRATPGATASGSISSPIRRAAPTRSRAFAGSREARRLRCASARARAASTRRCATPSSSRSGRAPIDLVRHAGVSAALPNLRASRPSRRCGTRSASIFAIRGCASCSGATRPIAARRPSRRRRR